MYGTTYGGNANTQRHRHTNTQTDAGRQSIAFPPRTDRGSRNLALRVCPPPKFDQWQTPAVSREPESEI
eukprot:3449763-Alexandrium_andersonii.AAC.1